MARLAQNRGDGTEARKSKLDLSAILLDIQGGQRDMRTARYIITIAYDDDKPTIITKLADDGATVTLIVARTFEEASTLYHQAEDGKPEA